MAKRSALGEKLDEVRDRIAAAAVKARRDPVEVTLVAVTKTAGPEQIRELLQLGVSDLGESRVQQLAQRAGQVAEFLQTPKIVWRESGRTSQSPLAHDRSSAAQQSQAGSANHQPASQHRQFAAC